MNIVGKLYSWGTNEGDEHSGQLGLGHYHNEAEPTILGSNHWKNVSAGWNYILGIQADDSLWIWGVNRPTPEQVESGTNWLQVSAAYDQIVGIKIDGTLWVFDNGPFDAKQIGADLWLQVSTGYAYTLAIRNDGTLWAWGNNEKGQLGLGDTVPRVIPTQIGTHKWTQISTGAYHATAIREDGSLWAWGDDSCGQLGLGNHFSGENYEAESVIKLPTQIMPGSTWIQVSSADHTLAIQQDGSLWAWGWNQNGQLGLGNSRLKSENEFHNKPEQIGSQNWKQISAGFVHSLGIQQDGSLWFWGNSRSPELGLWHPSYIGNSPKPILNVSNSWIQVSAGEASSFAIQG